MHDYAFSELRRRALYWLDKFKCTLNETYEEILRTQCDPHLEERVRDWIRTKRRKTNTDKVTEAIGDFFEFAALFFIGHERKDLLLQMVTNSFRMQYNLESDGQGDQDVERAIAWGGRNYPQEEAHAVFMLEAVEGEDIAIPQDEELHDVCCVCNAELEGEEDTDYIVCPKCVKYAC